jgi:hypothetical protein
MSIGLITGSLLLVFGSDPLPKGWSIPLVDLDDRKDLQVLVDREKGQYLGHPTTVLLEDGKTILCVYPKGHGKGAILHKKSTDGGLTWSERIPVPENWSTSKETPTLHRLIDPEGKKRLVMFSGLYPVRMASSEDDGKTWSPLEKVGDYGGIVAMGSVASKKTGPGHYLAWFHDDGRYFSEKPAPKKPIEFTLYQIETADGGKTWSAPTVIQQSQAVHLCEPGVIRSPDGKTLALLLRENRRVKNSHIIFSHDEGKTWSEPTELCGSLTGDRHTAVRLSDGRYFISFRDMALQGPTRGDWVAWVGTWEDIIAMSKGEPRQGSYRLRLKKNHKGSDCAYPGVELLPDGTIVTTTYGHWAPNESPWILSVRLKISEVDAQLRKAGTP